MFHEWNLGAYGFHSLIAAGIKDRPQTHSTVATLYYDASIIAHLVMPAMGLIHELSEGALAGYIASGQSHRGRSHATR